MKRWTGRHTVLAVAGVAVLVLLAGYAVVTSTRNADNVVVANETETRVPASDDATEERSAAEASAGKATPTEGEPAVTTEAEGAVIEDDRPSRLRSATRAWNTDWSKRIIEYDELLSGGPPRDGIPSIDDPRFIGPEDAAEWLADNEPVIALEIDGDARAYPLQVLTWHEIVNDTIEEVPVLVTFCPLCNSAITVRI